MLCCLALREPSFVTCAISCPDTHTADSLYTIHTMVHCVIITKTNVNRLLLLFEYLRTVTATLHLKCKQP